MLTDKIESERLSAAVPFGVDDAVGVPEVKWFVAIVKPRQEKSVAERLLALGYEAYVAAQKELHVWKNGRRKMIDRVVIPSVVFINCTERQRREIVALPYISRFLVNRTADTGKLNRPVAVVSGKEIEKLKFMLGQSDYQVEFGPVTYKIRDRVRVIRGSLLGLVGEISDTSEGAQTLTVVIDQLGCARVTISSQDVEMI